MELPSSVSVCKERGFWEVKVLNVLTIQSMRLVLDLTLDCFISLKKEKVAFLILDGVSLVGSRSLER